MSSVHDPIKRGLIRRQFRKERHHGAAQMPCDPLEGTYQGCRISNVARSIDICDENKAGTIDGKGELRDLNARRRTADARRSIIERKLCGCLAQAGDSPAVRLANSRAMTPAAR